MQKVTFILFPGFQMLAYILATETLRLANKCAGNQMFSWQSLTATNETVEASNGMRVEAESQTWETEDFPDLILLCAGYEPLNHVTSRVRAYLARANKASVMLGGVDTGTVILAQLGLLDGYQAVLHYEAEGAFRETWPQIRTSGQIYCIDKKRLTAAGGTATGDAMLAWLAQEVSDEFATATAEAMSHGSIRSSRESQQLASSIDPVLNRMRVMMKENLTQPLSQIQICENLKVSQKHLRRRCQKAFGLTPQSYYLTTRLEEASYLLRNTHMPITEIALVTGFGSISGFSRSFKRKFHASPRVFRNTLNGH